MFSFLADYKSRPEVTILKNFSLTVQPGSTVALVGESGSGKSSIIKLLERFYDPIDGTVSLDGKPLKDLNVPFLRKHIGIVTQVNPPPLPFLSPPP
jgi:ABC-type multidrug transport system fused ATPase/permease subunit